MRTKYFIAILVLLAVGLLPAPAHAGGVVTVCDEAHLLAALAGGGTVTFACGGTITLTAEIVIVADTTIDGSGQSVTISGNHAVRVFKVNVGITLNLSHLTVVNGYSNNSSGGGIYNGGTLNVWNSTFSGNTVTFSPGGAIYNSQAGALNVRNSEFLDNNASGGGGIDNRGTLTVDECTFSGNSVLYDGGGVSSFGFEATATISNTTFTDNSASYLGAAILNQYGVMIVSGSTFSDNYAGFGGGGIMNKRYGAVLVSNSSFSANHGSGGGIYNDDHGTTIVANCTFSDHTSAGGSIYNLNYGSGSTITLKNSIVTGSWNCRGTITDGGGNLSFPDATCPGINADPLLGPLQDNGGPTWTMALSPGSAAIDAANDTTCAADPVDNRDQRGVVRPQGVHCDIGAFERPVKWLPIMLVQ
jgi:hypothetical protein